MISPTVSTTNISHDDNFRNDSSHALPDYVITTDKVLNALQFHEANMWSNMSVWQGIILSDWKVDNVMAIFMKEDKEVLLNYRPISLTSVVCKY